jgi:hypothetical protein
VRVFSASIETFLQKLDGYARDILRNEFGVKVARKRFHTSDGWRWPIALVAIDDRSRLGYFDPDGLTIGIHRSLMYSAKNRVLKDILRHELAHYFTHIEHHRSGFDFRAHGAEFRAVCEKYGLPPEARAATLDLREENDAIEGELQSEAVIVKIRKLMSLAQSDNEHEAELATLRANQLILKHNLDVQAAVSAAREGDTEYCVDLVLASRRNGPRISAIGQILQEFLVYPVFTSAGLEVTGSRANVENARYIADYLNRELRALWKADRAHNSRLKEKAFMAALAGSYVKKLKAAKHRMPACDRNALVALNEELSWATTGAYGGGLHSRSSSVSRCRESSRRGAEAGSNLNIRRGVSPSGIVRLLGG